MSGVPDTAIVLVGGRGTRLGALTVDRPKPLLEVAGRPFLDWPMRQLVEAGIQRIVLAAGHRADQVEQFAQKWRSPGVSVAVVSESQPLGTGGAIAAAFVHCHDAARVVVANGDSIIADDLGALFATMDPHADVTLVGAKVADGSRFGCLEVDASGSLVAIGGHSGPALINAGLYVFAAGTIRRFPATRPLSLEADVLPALLHDRATIRVIPSHAAFIDIGVPESLARAGDFVRQLVPKVLT